MANPAWIKGMKAPKGAGKPVGSRGGGGRPSSKTVALRWKICNNTLEALKSFKLLCKLRDDPKQAPQIRVECAKIVLDRVLGKPQQEVRAEVNVSDLYDVESRKKDLIESLREVFGG